MSRKNAKQDLFNSAMSLGDHLEELRARLIMAFIGLGIAMVICLIFGKYLIAFLERPYVNIARSQQQNITPADPNSTAGNSLNNIEPPNRLQSLAPADGFISYMKICTIAGLLLSSPWVFYHLWMFVSAGLYPNERRYAKAAVPFSAILFVAGAMFFLFIIAPLTMNFLILFNKNFLGVDSRFTFKFYISFITSLMLVFGVGFQTPILVFFLNKMGLVSIETLRKSRKYVILAIFVLAAMATPPDPASQLTLAIPLYFLYELGIILCYFSGKKAKESDK